MNRLLASTLVSLVLGAELACGESAGEGGFADSAGSSGAAHGGATNAGGEDGGGGKTPVGKGGDSSKGGSVGDDDGGSSDGGSEGSPEGGSAGGSDESAGGSAGQPATGTCEQIQSEYAATIEAAKGCDPDGHNLCEMAVASALGGCSCDTWIVPDHATLGALQALSDEWDTEQCPVEPCAEDPVCPGGESSCQPVSGAAAPGRCSP